MISAQQVLSLRYEMGLAFDAAQDRQPTLTQNGQSNQFEKCYQAARAGVYPGPPI
jgi:hypothetical protein